MLFLRVAHKSAILFKAPQMIARHSVCNHFSRIILYLQLKGICYAEARANRHPAT